MKKTIKEFLLYVIVGAIATLVEWILFYVLNDLAEIHYTVSTVIAYIASTFANWLAGRLIMFKASEKGIVKELIGIYAASVIGLLMNLLIMWLLVDVITLIQVPEMVAKVIATGIVFFWNFIIRKLVIYKKADEIK